MHIKQLTICGFKAYRDAVTISNLHEGYNLFVGRNGTGKSSLFDALTFLLGEGYSNLRPEDRRSLLHDGPGPKVMQAYVEVVFDNSDGRLDTAPVESEEVTLRRTIGLKKDQYFLNRRPINKADVSRILELAGFSRSNPYYIVPQGKIKSLANMGDSERLDLLKEVAGTGVYERRREESQKLLRESTTKLDKILEVLAVMDEREKDLQADRQELTEYQALDRKRKAIEYTLYDTQLEDTRARLDAIESGHEGSLDHKILEKKQLSASLKSLTDDLEQTAEALQALRDEHAVASEETEALTARLAKLSSATSDLQLKISEVEDRMTTDAEKEAELAATKERIMAEIKATKVQLEAQHRSYEEEVSRLEELEDESHRADRRYKTLCDKRGRKDQFHTKADRDKHLKAKIKRDQDALEKAKKAVQDLMGKADKVDAEIEKSMSDAKVYEARMAELQASLDASSTKKLNDELIEVRRKLTEANRAAQAYNKKADENTKAAKAAQHTLDRCCPRDTRTGIEEIKRLVDEEGWRGIHGRILDLIVLTEPAAQTAIEVIGGRQLFHVVVDDEEVAARCVKHLSRTKSGRVTFVPLRDITPPTVKFPQSKEVRPLLDCLNYDKHFEPAIRQLFGTTLLCSSFAVASDFSRSHKINCVTPDGTEASRKGELRGGFHDPSRSIFTSQTTLAELMEEQERLDIFLKRANEESTRLSQEATRIEGEILKTKSQHKGFRSNLEQTKRSLHQEKRKISKLPVERDELRRRAQQLNRTEVSHLEAQIRNLQEELASEMVSALSPAEAAELQDKSVLLQELRTQIEAQKLVVDKADAQKTQLETRLSSFLEPRLEEVLAEMAKIGTAETQDNDDDAGNLSDQLESLTEQLDLARAAEAECAEQLARATASLNEKDRSLATTQQALESLRDRVSATKAERSDVSNQVEKLLATREGLMFTRGETMTRIRDLGTVPADVDAFRGKSVELLSKALAKVNEQLKGYSNVNKKALSQFSHISEQREGLLKRKEELVEARRSIQNVITVLDQKKDEAIARTFKDVARHFSEVFATLTSTSGGSGKLVMRTGPTAPSPGGAGGAVESFQGVSIRVSFATGGQMYNVNAISGGQQTLVALAIIFAIQRTDPAPFYIFDEIDQALDKTYGQAVAGLIASQASSELNRAQYITSTFAEHQVHRADQLYGIAHQHQVSTVHDLSREDALRLVMEIAAEEKAKTSEDIESGAETDGGASAGAGGDGHLATPASRKVASAAGLDHTVATPGRTPSRIPRSAGPSSRKRARD